MPKRRLGTYSRRGPLYRASRELGRVDRTPLVLPHLFSSVQFSRVEA